MPRAFLCLQETSGMQQQAGTIQFLELDKLTPDALSRIMRRAEKDIRDLLPLAQEVIDRVRVEGDTAVVDYTRRFDTKVFEASMLRAMPADFERARHALDPDVTAAIRAAHDNI